MEVVEKRFENFKTFIREKTKDNNQFIKEFMNTPLNFFLATIKTKISNGIDKDKCLDEIFNAAELKKDECDKLDIEKLIKYMEYFVEITTVI